MSVSRNAAQTAGVLCLVAGAYLAGRWQTQRPAPGAAVTGPSATATQTAPASQRKVLYYRCPMHPQYKSDRPGTAPCCGMRLEPVYADGGPEVQRSLPPGAIQVSPERQQLIGVRFGQAEITPCTRVIRAVGKVLSFESGTVLLADVLEHEAPSIFVGQSALVTRPYHPAKSFWARVEHVYPRLDPVTRTLKARLKTADTSLGLIPDTLVNVEFRAAGPPCLTVPADAVLDSGLAKTVYIDLGQGYLAPRQVATGRRFADRVEILKGLQRGERVVVSGNFLIDSESQLQAGARTAEVHSDRAAEAGEPASHLDRARGAAATAAMPAASAPVTSGPAVYIDPVCGMEVRPGPGARFVEYRGKTYYFCSTQCRRQFAINPGPYAEKLPSAEGVQEVVSPEPGPPPAAPPPTAPPGAANPHD